jgi:DNA-binding Lrp family transcriptional regulator
MTAQGDLLSWVPYVKGSDTSRAAAESMVPHVSAIEASVLAFVKRAGRMGTTCDEIEDRMKLAHQTASARIKGLADKGLIRDSGARRKTRSGRAARVYVVCG